MIKAGIVGITGFTGLELIKILLNHKDVKIDYLASRGHVGSHLSDIYPQFSGIFDKKIGEINTNKLSTADVVFLALPHTVSAKIAKELFGKTKIIDLSADFRLKDPEVYKSWYKVDHPAKELLKHATYGLVELKRDSIKQSILVANPGCYATSVILALAPVADIVDSTVVIDSKSGVSGAGRAPKEGLQFCEVNENFKAYAIEGHRHIPEMEQQLKDFNLKSKILFIPHLLPVQRGILSTIYIKTEKQVDYKKLFNDFYKNDFFVRVVDTPPSLNNVRGTNFCDIYPYYDNRTKSLIIISVIDNLIKGASGQAVQNMNVMFGFEENEGLGGYAYYP